jgi:LmbE family N-acetylglucosaminyl deacetylase
VTVTGDAAGELTPRAAGAPPEHEVRAAGGSAGEQPPAGAGAQPSDVEPTTPSVTPPGAWEAALRRHRPLPFDPTGLERGVVVAAHPDDETIGVGGLLQELHAAGASITLVVATDGEAAYPGLDGPARRELGRARRVELADALRVQGLADAPVHWLGLPDSGLADRVPELTDRLAPLLADADAYLAPWTSDPHPDHRAAGAAAAAAAPVTARGWAYPIWTWAWTGPDDPGIPWERARAVTVDARVRATRRRAVDCFTSQVRPGPDGSAPVLAAGLLEHVDRNTDIVFREPRQGSAPLSRFTELYAGGNDPWRAGSWYERRKRAVLLASLPRETYGTAFEPGCGAGELSVELASRCRLVLASDPVPEAVERARARARGLPVRVEEAALPSAVPPGPVDLAVFSEVLYYVDDGTVLDTVDRTSAALRPGADVVLVHWRGWPAEAPRDAEETHRMVRARSGFETLVEHVDEEFLLHVLRRW